MIQFVPSKSTIDLISMVWICSIKRENLNECNTQQAQPSSHFRNEFKALIYGQVLQIRRSKWPDFVKKMICPKEPKSVLSTRILNWNCALWNNFIQELCTENSDRDVYYNNYSTFIMWSTNNGLWLISFHLQSPRLTWFQWRKSAQLNVKI